MYTEDRKKIDEVKNVLEDASIDNDAKVKKLYETLEINKALEFATFSDFIDEYTKPQYIVEERYELSMKMMESLMWWRRWNVLGELLRPYSNEEIEKLLEYEHDILWTPSLENNPYYTEDLPRYDGKTFTDCKNYAPYTK